LEIFAGKLPLNPVFVLDAVLKHDNKCHVVQIKTPKGWYDYRLYINAHVVPRKTPKGWYSFT
jgi:hypothetical protein